MYQENPYRESQKRKDCKKLHQIYVPSLNSLSLCFSGINAVLVAE